MVSSVHQYNTIWIFHIGSLICLLVFEYFEGAAMFRDKSPLLSTSMLHIGIKKMLASGSQLDQTLLINLVTAVSA